MIEPERLDGAAEAAYSLLLVLRQIDVLNIRKRQAPWRGFDANRNDGLPECAWVDDLRETPVGSFRSGAAQEHNRPAGANLLIQLPFPIPSGRNP